jgi:hypothetical protein
MRRILGINRLERVRKYFGQHGERMPQMDLSNSFDFSYPEYLGKKYDPMVNAIAKGFIP